MPPNYGCRYLVASFGILVIMGLATWWISYVWSNIPATIAIIFIATTSGTGFLLLSFNPHTPIPSITLSPFWRTVRNYAFAILLAVSITVAIIYFPGLNLKPNFSSHLSPSPNPSSSPRIQSTSKIPDPHLCALGANSSGIGITAVAGEPIGISDGRFAFDAQRSGGNLKRQGADRFKAGDSQGAIALWQQEVGADTNDAEALIYLEDQHVLASHTTYITLIVATMLTGDASTVSTGRDDLQGAYVAQKEFNDGDKLSNGTQIRLLIANSGSQTACATTVAQQIVQVARADKTIIGVMGWPFSSRALNAVDVLTAAHIPIVSQTASSDLLTGKSAFFFRVAPSNKGQGMLGAQYAEQALHATSAALFVDPGDAYSSSLANDFKQQFTTDGNTVVEERYKVGQPSALPALLQDALNRHVDMIYFAGYASDMGTLLTDLPSGNLPVMGGDALYEVGGYPSSARPNFNRLRFTAFAYPDEWDILGQATQKPAFFKEYPADFDPYGLHGASPYGYDRADADAMLSYDAMLVLFQSANNVLNEGQALSPDTLQQALTQINGNLAIQGVSGQISFGADGNPINKAIVVLYVDPNNHIHVYKVLGCFFKGAC